MNKKIMKKIMIFSVTAVSAFATVFGASCSGGDDPGNNPDGPGKPPKPTTFFDNEKDPVVFSSQNFDKVFNPFYSTSAMDANAVGMTQIGMIGNDKEGNPTYGEDESVVTLDLETKAGTYNGKATTEYYFVLKNNVRFSNGTYLTMKDVLFNMYVYLDPAYTGSSTMYSTDIVGLKKYRTQETDENEQDSFEKMFQGEAEDRIDALILAVNAIKDEHSNELMTADDLAGYIEAYAKDAEEMQIDTYAHIVEDYARALRLFKEELQSDYNNSKDSYADEVFTDKNGVIHKNLLTCDVEMFLLNEGLITWDKNDNDGNGALHCAVGNLEDVRKWTEEKAIQTVFDVNVPDNFESVVTDWATAETLATEIAGAAREAYFENNEVKYTSIDGIQFINMEEPVTVNGKTYGVPEYNDNKSQVVSGNEVLKVTIYDVDPKAIWNFSFGVAPMYYYSNAEEIALFDYKDHFGVKYSSDTFMNKTIKDSSKIGLPVGAGPYMACSASDKTSGIGAGDFLSNNVMYFIANPYYLMGAPVIKHLRFQVVGTNQIMNTLQTGEIDFGEPNAKQEIIDQLKGLESSGYGYSSVQTAGYGYVGINSSKVPNIYVRRAIMHCIDTKLSVEYYKGTAKPIYRSMSLSSWAYPGSATAYYPYVGDPIPSDLSGIYKDYANYVRRKGWKAGYTMTEAEQVEYIKYLVEELGGYDNGSGIYSNGNDSLKYTFTVAGQENDHPAFMSLYLAGEFLTKKVKGFQIITRTDNNALTKLASGSLTVWAAAWGSTIDPDMYQVYHMDSKATSTLNWGYNSIKNNQTKYWEEYELITRLSDLIEAARKTDVQADRAMTYSTALDLVMELAVELPMYQRDDLFAYNALKIDTSTFTPEGDRSAFKGLTADIFKLSLITKANLEK